MPETLSLITERVDDLPLLLSQMQHLGLAQQIDIHLLPHGNRQGISYGWLACVWLSHILSQADHRMNHVRGWVQQRQHTLHSLLPLPFVETDFTDDRLADLLRALSVDAAWEALETDLNQKSIAVYDLPTQVVRLDATTVPLDTDPCGLFRCGHSKDHRPEVPQVKIMAATLDPLWMPLVTTVVAGNSADDPLYLPAVEQVRTSLEKRGLLYVGDCKMAAKETRAGIARGGDFYLCPLSALQMPPEELAARLKPVLEGHQSLTRVERLGADGQPETIAFGYEFLQTQATQDFSWQERRLLVRSLAFAAAAERGLDTRLASAQQQIAQICLRGKGRRPPTCASAAHEAVATLLTRYQVQGLFKVQITEHTTTRFVRGYAGKPDREVSNIQVHLACQPDLKAIAATKASLGWRVYATNATAEPLNLGNAVLLYRDEYRIEQSFARLKGHPLSVSPLYVSREDHAKGLLRLLSLGLRVLSLLEFVLRRRLTEQSQPLLGLYAGNPKRATMQPTAERLLEAFGNITLTLIRQSGQCLRHLTPLSPLQQQILELLDGWPQVYTRLLDDSGFPALKMSEP
jgi:transposase